MALRSHSRQKSDDSKLAFELVEVQTTFDTEDVGFRGPKIRSRLSRCGCRVREGLRKFGTKVNKIKINLTVLSIIVLFLALALPIGLAVMTYRLYPTQIDISLSSFEIPSQNASLNEDAYSVAKKRSKTFTGDSSNRAKRTADTYPYPWPDNKDVKHKSVWYKHTQYRSKWNIDLIYLPQNPDENIFTVEGLTAAHKIEQNIMNYPGFLDFCWKWSMVRLDPILSNKYNACTPPISLIDFFFPTQNLGMTFFDGQGEKITEKSMNSTLKFLLSKQFTYWFVDSGFSVDNKKSKFLRAQIKFGYPLRGYHRRGYNHGQMLHDQDAKYEMWMEKFVEYLETQSNDKVKLLYGGQEVFDHLVNKTLWSDLELAKYTLIIIVLFIFVLTSFSLFLTFFGMLSISMSFLFAYFMFRVIFKIPTLGILSGASLFIIVGIGVDDVFVFINTFMHAKNAVDIRARLKHTVSTAGGATFFTSFTTAAAFGANCLSKIPAIHDFGLFMMLVVICCWFTVLFIIPPTLYLWHQYCRKLEQRFVALVSRCIPVKCCCASKTNLPDDIQQFLAGNKQDSSLQTIESPSSTQDNEPLVSDDSLPNSEDSSDLLYMSDQELDNGECNVPLLPSLSLPSASLTQRHSFTCSLQSCLYNYCKPVIYCRYLLLIIYIIFLGGSIYLNTKLTAAKKPPAFFKDTSDLQQILNLKYNMSNDNYDCKICDDIVEVGSNFISGLGKTTKSPTLPTTMEPIRKPTVPATFKPTTVGFLLRTPSTPKKSTPSARHSTRPTFQQVASTNSPKTIESKTTILTTQKSTLSSHILSSSTLPSHSTTGITDKLTTKGTLPTNTTLPLATTTPRTSVLTAQKSTLLKAKTLKTAATPGNDIEKRTPVTKQVVKTKGPTPVPKEPATTPPDLCSVASSCEPASKPVLGKTVHVKVVFGIKSINRTLDSAQHVLGSKGKVIMDPKFTLLYKEHKSKFISYMCQICTAFSNNKELVKEGGSQCFPDWLWQLVERYRLKDCEGVKPSNTDLKGNVDANMFEMDTNQIVYRNSTKALWLMMTFETTIDKGMSSTKMLMWYYKFNNFLKSQLKKIGDDSLDSTFHTSESWVHMFMEVIAISGAIYGIAFSLVLCLIAVVIFTGHIMLSIIVIFTILGVLCFVVGIFYLVGWQLGAVEAISLSVLVGTSVDYCVHLIDGFIISGQYVPGHLTRNKDIRSWRTLAAVSHIGSSILSSALTTIAASIPLCLTTIQLFAKFGQILAINTAISIVYTLSFSIAFLTIVGPAKFIRTYKSRAIALGGVGIVVGMVSLILYIISLKGTPIPGPDGNPLFKV